MSEHEQHTAFLRVLINHQNSGETCRSLGEELTETINRERCVGRAIFGVLILGALAVAGLGYSLVLLPSSALNDSSTALKVCKIAGLAAGICLAFFLPVWAQTRRQLRKLHHQCRQAIIGAIQTPEEAQSTRIGKIETLHPEESTSLRKLRRLPKAS